MGKICRTPMGRLQEIVEKNGYRIMEIGPGHMRIFDGTRKVLDYYPVSMKVFNYREWFQLTYPTAVNGMDVWERELQQIIDTVRSI